MSVWIEVALNGPWSRARQKLMPVTVDEIVADGIACARAGAAVIHVHAYDPDSGRQNDDPDTYAAIFEGIRSVEDVIVYPTLPFIQSAEAFRPGALEARYAAVEALGERGLMEWGVVDPGSTNLATLTEVEAGAPGSVYLNPGEHIRHGLELAARFGYVPSYAIYEPGFVRLGAALARGYPGCPAPLYRFMFSDMFTFGFPPEGYALEAYLALLDSATPGSPWMAAGLGVDIRPLIPEVVARGGHVRVGLEDAPLGTEITNAEWVESAVALVQKAGGRPARAAEIRQALSAAPAVRQAARKAARSSGARSRLGEDAGEVRALLFDTFGTVVDWRGGIAREAAGFLARHGLAGDPERFADDWRARYQPAMEVVRRGDRPFTRLDVIHRENLEDVLRAWGLDPGEFDAAELDELNRAWHRLDPWPDSVEGLRRLRRRFLVAPLSNGNIALLTNMAKRASLPWDTVLGAEVVRAYKPQPSAYLDTAEVLGLHPGQCMMVAAHNDDLHAARTTGMRTAFVLRPTEHGPAQTTDLSAEASWDVVARDFLELADMLQTGIGSTLQPDRGTQRHLPAP